jgi:hypothetical protein
VEGGRDLDVGLHEEDEAQGQERYHHVVLCLFVCRMGMRNSINKNGKTTCLATSWSVKEHMLWERLVPHECEGISESHLHAGVATYLVSLFHDQNAHKHGGNYA